MSRGHRTRALKATRHIPRSPATSRENRLPNARHRRKWARQRSPCCPESGERIQASKSCAVRGDSAAYGTCSETETPCKRNR
jgi:hypothetical protein